MPYLYKIGVVLLFLLILALIWIQIEAKKSKRKKEASNDISKEDKANVVKKNQELQGDIANLRSELSERKGEIESLNTILNQKEKEIDFLRKQIVELNISSSRSNLFTNGSNKNKEDNKDEAALGENIDTKTNSYVGLSNYYELAVINGNLVKAESEQTYYRAWRVNGQLIFEFVNNDRTRKAINNRTIIIEPFCIKLESSKSPDISEEIETKTPGILNDDFTLRKKAEIIYK